MKCECGEEAVIAFNMESLCSECYQRKMQKLAENSFGKRPGV